MRLVNSLTCVTTLAILVCSPAVLHAEPDDRAALRSAYAEYQKYAQMADYELALLPAQIAYQAGYRVFGDQDANTATLAYNYGQMLLKTDNPADAVEVLSDAVTYYGNVYGRNAAELIPALMSRATASVRAFGPGKEAQYYERALELARRNYGPESKQYGQLLLDAGTELLDDAQSRTAGKYLEDAYETLTTALGGDDPAAGQAAWQLARFEFADKHYEDAKGHLLAALTTFEDPDMPSNSIEILTHTLLVAVYEELGEPEKATPHCLAIGRSMAASTDRKYLPLFRKPPRYPSSALESGEEGYAEVRFTVDKEGFVRDPEVIGGNRVFRLSAKTAVKAWRYAPRFVDGKPVDTHDITTRLTYSFADP